MVVRDPGDHATMILSGEIAGGVAREIEQCLLGRTAEGVRRWTLDLSRATLLDMACAYALARPALFASPPVRVSVVGATEGMRRVLEQTEAAEVLEFAD